MPRPDHGDASPRPDEPDRDGAAAPAATPAETDEESRAAHEALAASDVGLPAGTRMPFHFVAARDWSPLVISFPHVGLAWPHDLRPKPQADFARNADYEVHTLYGAVGDRGAACMAAVFSRLVVDLNRAPDDISRAIVPDHPAPRPRRTPGVPAGRERDESPEGRPSRGVVWAHAVGGVRVLPSTLPYETFRRRIEAYHTPYYRALATLLERRRRRFGFAILLDAHSMPSTVGPDLVVGTLDGGACAPEIAKLALAALNEPSSGQPAHASLRVCLDDPYRGGELIRRFGRPREGLHALQLEVSRGLYMDEGSLQLYRDGAGRPTAPGTDRDLGRGTPTAPRQGRDLAELRRRVTCLVGRLARHR